MTNELRGTEVFHKIISGPYKERFEGINLLIEDEFKDVTECNSCNRQLFYSAYVEVFTLDLGLGIVIYKQCYDGLQNYEDSIVLVEPILRLLNAWQSIGRVAIPEVVL